MVRAPLLVAVLALLATAAQAELPEWTPPTRPPTFAVHLVFGRGSTEAMEFSGKASVSQGEVVKVEGWRFSPRDEVTGVDSWTCTQSESTPRRLRPDEIARGRKQGQPRPLPIGVIIYVDSPRDASVNVETAAGSFSIKLAELTYGRAVRAMEGLAVARRVPISSRLTTGPLMDDFASIAEAPDGDIYVAWLSWEPDADKVVAQRQHDGTWEEPFDVSPEPGDNFETQMAQAGDGSIWGVWSSREGTNWDLWGRRIDGGKAGELVRLTDDGGAEFYHTLTTGPDGKLWLAWQAARNGQYDIYLKSYSEGTWGKEIRVSDSPANDWEPALAVDSTGRAHVAWDTYRNGNYDICYRSLADGKLSKVQMITQAPHCEWRPSIACDKEDRVWLAWAQSEVLWGKDQGFVVKGRGLSRIHSARKLRLACMTDGRLIEPESALLDAIPQGRTRNDNELPQIVFDGDGRLWVIYRRKDVKQGRGGGSNRTFWDQYAAYWDGEQWQTEIWIPYTVGREDVRPAVVPSPQGGLTIAWASDERPWRNPIPGNYTDPGQNNIYFAGIQADGAMPEALPALKEYTPPTRDPMPEDLHPNEAQDVAQRRRARWTVGGEEYVLLAGETHRHTDVSFDGGGDGSMWDMMRYEIDAVQQDFIAAWDHDNGGGQDYGWWRSQKIADIFYIEDVFEPLYGYERSVGYPNGHRNVTFAKRGVRCFARVNIPNPDQNARRKVILSPDDTKKLYEDLRDTGGICFSHTSATDMGTDWRDNDPELEPIMEIYQGCRTSYEYEGAPKAATAEDVSMQVGGFRPAGFLWKAYEKGLHLGIMAASDHGSTHISYCSLWAPEFSREAMFDAMKARHTYGATDNIILRFGAGEHMMGDIFSAEEAVPLDIEIEGTAPVATVDIMRNNEIIYSRAIEQPEKSVKFTYNDNDIQSGENYYYVRALQTDEQIAWSSPMWITYP